jgi:hypothetical protein
MKNKQMEYEQEGKKWELTQPTMKATDDSIIVQAYNPKNKAYETRVVKTDGILGDAKKFKDFIEATGADSPAAQAMQLKLVTNTLKSDPVALHGTLQRMAIENLLSTGAGQAVFGEKFVQAQKQATEKLLSSGSVSTDPEKTRTAINREVSSILMSDPELMKSGWEELGRQHGSVASMLLLEGQQ